MQIDLNSGQAQQAQSQGQDPRFAIPVPGLHSAIGAGSAIERFTRALGIEPCGGCKQRRDALDRMVRFNPWAT